MITVYKRKAIPKDKELVTLNDIYFNTHTAELLDGQAEHIVSKIDGSRLVGKYSIISRFGEATLNVDRLSTGCKTVLNILYNPDKIFDIRECGDNALDAIYALPQGNVFCSYPLISFDMSQALACDRAGCHVVDSYEALKEWWENEN